MKIWDVFDTLTDIGVALVNRQQFVVRCNQAFADIFDDDKIHVAGKSVIELTAIEDRDKARVNFASLFEQQGNSVRHRKRYQKPNGTTVEKMLHTVAYKEQEGWFCVSFVYDVAETSELAKRCQELEQALAAMVMMLEKQGQSKMTVNLDQSTNQSADRGGSATISNGSNRSQFATIVVVALCIAAVAFAVLAFGGKLEINDGKRQIEVEGQE